ncbi:MAG TPA: hypothetical protein VET88_06550 [Gammaproteobacteria bacterium]|nr:hypothetical protein [Gammaproteobacteria bacterium]
MTAEDADAWFASDAEHETIAINEGELAFLTAMPESRTLQTDNRLTLTADSLADGWVQLDQCQGNLDPVPALEIVYGYQTIRDLRITSFHGMERAWVEDGSVQMVNLGEGAGLCVSAGVRVLRPAGAGRYELRSGPFHRRFLDGYYPLQLEYRLRYPADLLQVEVVQPEAQPGFTVVRQPGELKIDALFEGRLTIRVGLRTP